MCPHAVKVADPSPIEPTQMKRSAFTRPIAASWPALLLLPASFVVAQPSANLTLPLQVPEYRSVFEQYRKYSDAPASSWRDANDNVARIGGWRAYAREMHAPEPADPAPAGPGAAPAPPGTAPALPTGDAAPAGSHAPAPAPAGGHAGHGRHGVVR
jgi:hypothetical protein